MTTPAERSPFALPLRPAFFVALATLAVCAIGLLNRRQVGFNFLPDEWYARGVNLRLYGTLGVGNEPMTFRAPGYAAWVAAVVWVLPRAEVASEAASEPERLLQLVHGTAGPRAVYWSQAVLLAATAGLLVLWCSRFGPTWAAVGAGLTYGVNPYSLILVGTPHYETLHLFGLVASGLALQWSLETRSAAATVASGALMGLTTLVRPLTLIFPPFALAAYALHDPGSLRRAVRSAMLFCAGMALVIVPWTARNYAVAGRLIPVNSQTWVAFWAATSTRMERDPDHLRWQTLWMSPESAAVQAAVRRGGFVRYPDDVRQNLLIEDAFRAQAFHNLRTHPAVYLSNVATAVATLALDFDRVLISAFEYLQQPGVARLPPKWFIAGNPQDFFDGSRARAFAVFVRVLTALSACGLLAAAWQRDRRLLAPLAVGLCVCVAHCVTWMDLRYYYVKLPFLFAFTGIAVARLSSARIGIPGLVHRPAAAWLVGAPLVGWLAWLTGSVLG